MPLIFSFQQLSNILFSESSGCLDIANGYTVLGGNFQAYFPTTKMGISKKMFLFILCCSRYSRKKNTSVSHIVQCCNFITCSLVVIVK